MKNISGIRDQIIKAHLDALFVTNQANVSYLTGFRGLSAHEREGFFLLTNKSAYLMLFPTYFGLYETGGKEFVIRNIKAPKKLVDHLKDICQNQDVRSRQVLPAPGEDSEMSQIWKDRISLLYNRIVQSGRIQGLKLLF